VFVRLQPGKEDPFSPRHGQGIFCFFHHTRSQRNQ
jgi:hypothetical protein